MRDAYDENQEVLDRMAADGKDLSQSRDIDFFVAFGDKASANTFAQHFRALGHSVSTTGDGPSERRPWDVTVVRHMMASARAITDFEDVLEEVAGPLGGRNDGWGILSPAPPAN